MCSRIWNPNGIQSISPGLRGTSYLGSPIKKNINPERVESPHDFYNYHVMPQSLAKILVHTVFSTKERRPLLRDNPLREELHHYIGGILNQLDCQPIIVGGVEDHVHFLCALSRTCTPAEMVKEVKRGSSLWLKTKRSRFTRLCVAKWLRNFLHRFLANRNRARLHRRAGRTSPQGFISG